MNLAAAASIAAALSTLAVGGVAVHLALLAWATPSQARHARKGKYRR